MRVFLTGANGWIGSMIVQDMLDAGHSVVGLVRTKEKGEAFAGTDRPLVVTSGFLQTTGEKIVEEARPPVMPAFPRASEQAAFALAERGIHAMVVRNPRSVHGKGERHGFVPMLASVAREKGV